MATKITMFTKNDCGDCKRAKFMLAHCPVDVEIEEINVELEENQHHIEQQGLMTLPAFLMEDGNIIHGFHEGKIMNILGL
ncbi:glutaredoxin family protein [Bacillus wiedmannii]|uniref:glutaredoxin family protein n=1 Tax=Bacillus wiedmannii TaxID=1890302 RepID=UPI0007CB82F2|nr:glutaredoxin domain-containing protein [Bacillus wiedmannii]OAK35879.1 NrdH-redoxin [Bacillus wiedmannii]HDR7640763.1 glutaredoxin family protein [Bacillus wiedmannii]